MNDYREFITRLNTTDDLYTILENWYSRLNKLKEKYWLPSSGVMNEKAEVLMYALIERLNILGQVYTKAIMPNLTYKEGKMPLPSVAIAGEFGHEIVILNKHN